MNMNRTCLPKPKFPIAYENPSCVPQLVPKYHFILSHIYIDIINPKRKIINVYIHIDYFPLGTNYINGPKLGLILIYA